ncbi:hypothetical protein TEA_019927 [Camellia sinensis var. sinensis]|uniref:phosphoribosylformylglycinamidine cyclo-ligase n=1 Tax=Camellia sinensis var. sinensis TaxID=542762 RepID=A0A4S4CXG8_CAMSN|nr:hypothetical protein TEA_019927 [Camellia sinensis var. sinensis]
MSSSSNNHSESSGSSSGGGLTYKDAGVDIDAESELVRRIAKMAPVIGGFGGLFPLGDSYLVAGTDGVGTRLKLAFETGIHETTGIDLNPPKPKPNTMLLLQLNQLNPDSAPTTSASLDHNHTISTKPSSPSATPHHQTFNRKLELVMKEERSDSLQSMSPQNRFTGNGEESDGSGGGGREVVFAMAWRVDPELLGALGKLRCTQSITICAFQAAEMPNFYADGEYDLSGFAVGIVKRDSVIDGKNITVGDVLVGLPSSGVHSNGFSLVRGFAFALVVCGLHFPLNELDQESSDWLLDLFTGLYYWENLHHAVMENDGKEQRHKNDLLHVFNLVLAQSGLSLNNQLPGETVTLGEALMVPTVIYVKQVLDIISKGGVKGIAHVTGKIEDAEMRRTFNMGIGMVLVVSQEAAHRILGDAKGAYTAYRIGEVVSGDSVCYQ